MSTVYNEGPYRHWTAVSFPTSDLTVKISLDTASFRALSIGEFDPDTGLLVGPIGLPSFWQAVIRGVDSGEVLDFRNMSIVPFATVGNPQPTACDNTPTNYFTVPSGAAATDSDVPEVLGYIRGTAGSELFTSNAVLASFRRLDYNAGAGLCNIDTDADPLPGFINGESVTVSAT